MRRLKLIIAALFLSASSFLTAQTGLDIIDSMCFSSAGTITSGATVYYGISLRNTNNGQFNGTINYITAIDTFGTSGLTPQNLDTLSNIQQPASLNYGDTASYNDSLVPIININCRGGINTVVIWPVASITSYATVDSFRFNILVIEPAGIKENRRNSLVVLSPNPFSDKIYLVSPSGIMPEQVRIIDINGRLLKEEATNKAYIETADLKQGVYLIELYYPDGSRQIIKAIKE